ncbi:hypothetical protein VaNZ11_009638, partial [Volvox africanus]
MNQVADIRFGMKIFRRLRYYANWTTGLLLILPLLGAKPLPGWLHKFPWLSTPSLNSNADYSVTNRSPAHAGTSVPAHLEQFTFGQALPQQPQGIRQHRQQQQQLREQEQERQRQREQRVQTASARSWAHLTGLEARGCVDTTCTAPYNMYIASMDPVYGDSPTMGALAAESSVAWLATSADASSGSSGILHDRLGPPNTVQGVEGGAINICLTLVATGCFAPSYRTPCCAALARHLRQIEIAIDPLCADSITAVTLNGKDLAGDVYIVNASHTPSSVRLRIQGLSLDYWSVLDSRLCIMLQPPCNSLSKLCGSSSAASRSYCLVSYEDKLREASKCCLTCQLPVDDGGSGSGPSGG